MDSVFFEKQRLAATSMKWLYIVTTIISSTVMFYVLLEEGDKTELFITLGIFFPVMIGTYVLVFQMPALTRVTQRGIEYKYKPWIWNWKVLAWNDIEKVEIVNIDPLGDYGGWGYRFTWKGDRGIVLGSSKALKFTKKSGKHLALTTERKEEFKKAVERFMEVN
ncbi:MAG: hypothetical protein N4A46_07250 [Schleiferiaceae bacterium]|jgi:hypothetical protein|nr:hypothetical protein [Schleiferiaceae bacterium]